MTRLRRTLIILATLGWLLPFCASYWVSHDFIGNVVWPAAAFDKPYLAPWHPVAFADELFYGAMLWLAGVLLGWSIALTAPKNDRS